MLKYDYTQDELTGQSAQGKILNQIQPESVVLEFGCATGYMTQYMKEKKNCMVYILEMDQNAYHQAIQYAADGVCADIMSDAWFHKFENIRFDYILFADVLEHLTDPAKALIKAGQLLKDNGKILVSIPNVGHNDILLKLIDHRWDYTRVGLLDDTHVHFWGLKNLKDYFGRIGYGIVNFEYTHAKTLETEQFEATPEHLSEKVMEMVMSRPGGEIYQAVLALQKEAYIAQTNLEIIDPSAVLAQAQQQTTPDSSLSEEELVLLHSSKNDLVHAIKQMRAELAQAWQQFSQRDHQLNETMDRAARKQLDLEESLRQKQVENDELNRQLYAADEDRRSAWQQFAQRDEQLQQLQGEAERKWLDLEESLRQKQVENDELNRQLQAANEDRRSAWQQFAQRDEQLQQLQGEAERKRLDLEEALRQKQVENEELGRQVEQFDIDRKNAWTAFTEREKQLLAERELNSQNSKVIVELEEEVEQMSSVHQKDRQRIAEMRRKIDALEKSPIIRTYEKIKKI